MTDIEIPDEITHEDIKAAFPWVRHLPDGALGELGAAIEIYRYAAEIYSGKREPSGIDPTNGLLLLLSDLPPAA
jgi:hypothetical protein